MTDQNARQPHPLAAAILDQDDRALQPLSAPEWGTDGLFARPLSSLDAEEAGKLQAVNSPDLAAFIAARVICDAEGNRVFDDQDVPRLRAKHFAPIRRAVGIAYSQALLTATAERGMRGKSEDPSASAPGAPSPNDSAS